MKLKFSDLYILALPLASFSIGYAKATPLPKIVAVKSCAKVGLTGKNLNIGEELSFYKTDPEQALSAEENLKETVQVRVEERIQEGRYWGSFTSVTDEAQCKSWKNAIYSQSETLRVRRDLFVFRTGLEAVTTSLQTSGMGIMTSGRSQDFPFFYGGSFHFALFPMGSLGHDFVSQSIGFMAEALFAQGNEGWEFDTGESIKPKLLIFNGAFVVRPFFIGDRSPTSILVGAERFDLSFELINEGTFGRSPLRKIQCVGPALGFAQEVLLQDFFGFTIAGTVSPSSSCETDEITQQAAIALQEKEKERGSQPLPLAEIVSEKGLKSASALGGRAQLNYLPLNSLRFSLGGGFHTLRSKLNRNGNVQDLIVNRPEYFFGLELVIK